MLSHGACLAQPLRRHNRARYAPSPDVNSGRANVTLAMSHGERGAEVEHAQPAEVPRRNARHSDDVAGACVA